MNIVSCSFVTCQNSLLFLFLVPVSLSGCIVRYTCSQRSGLGEVRDISVPSAWLAEVD
jgi:hypothetical protein